MKTTITMVLGIALLISACKKNEIKVADTSTPLNASYVSRLDKVLDSVAKAKNLTGVTASVYMPGKGIWNKAYGISHAGVPMSTNMQLPVGSSTKTYVAALMLKLQEQGLLNINDTIGKWIKNMPNVKGSITIKQCLNHTAGLFGYTESPDFVDGVLGNLSKVWQPDELLQFVRTPYFEPGTGWEYSNTGFVIAGQIAAKVTGMSAKDALRKYILDPLSLSKTVFYPYEKTNAPVPHLWTNQINPGGALQDLHLMPGYSMAGISSTAFTAGSLMATAEENALFYNALMRGKVVGQQSLNQMKEFVETTIPGAKYGLGLFQMQGPFNGRVIINHPGNILGANCFNLYDTTSGVCISIMINQDVVDGTEPATVVSVLHKETLK